MVNELTLEEIKTMFRQLPGDFILYRLVKHKLEIVYYTPSVLKACGVDAAEFAKMTAGNALHIVMPEDREYVLSCVLGKKLEAGPIDCVFRIKHKTKGFFLVHAKAKVIGTWQGAPLILANYLNMDEAADAYNFRLNVTEQQLWNKTDGTNALQYYRLAIHGANLAVWEYDIKNKELRIPLGKNGQWVKHRYGLTSNVVKNVPEVMLPMGLTDKDRKNFLQLYEEMRQGKQYCSADIWFKTEHVGVPRCERITYYVVKDKAGKPCLAYGVGNDITAQKLEELNFHRAVQSILAANPEALCTFQVNLTKDLCTEGHGASAYILKFLQAKTATELFANILKIVPDSPEKQTFGTIFSRDGLLAAFARGKSNLSVEYRRKDDQGRLFWVRTYINLLKNPETEDIESIIYSLDISKEIRQRRILQIVTQEEYDFVAVLHVKTNKIEFMSLKSALLPKEQADAIEPGRFYDFDVIRNFMAQTWINAEDKELYLKASRLAVVQRALDAKGVYAINLRGHYADDPQSFICRKLQHYYLSDTHEEILLIENDVTAIYLQQQKKLQAAQAETDRITGILDSISCGISILYMPDAEHLTITYVNNRMYHLLGFNSPEDAAATDADTQKLIKAYFQDAFVGVHPEDMARVKKTFRDNYEKELFVVGPYRTIGAQGKYYWFKEEVRLKEVKADGRIFYATYYDMSEDVRLHQRLQKQLVTEKQLRREAMVANAAKTDFLSRMSHDIRTPLNGIIGMTYLAKEQKDLSVLGSYLKNIDTSSKFLLGLINDVLDMAKAESGKIELHPEPYGPQDFSDYFTAIIKPLCQEKQQQLVLEIKALPAYIPLMDKLRTNQIVFNLLSNAVKYTPEGGKITVKLHEKLVKPGRMAIYFSVADTGIGMSADFQKILFEPFSQEGRNDVSTSRGTGLGLAIVKQLVERMGGRIYVHSQLGKGTQFTLECETDCIAASEYNKKPAAASRIQGYEALAGKHILVCEDHPLNQHIAKALLERKQMLVTLAEDGKRGLELFAASATGFYACVLMDIRMPVLDGYETTRRLRALPRADAAKVPIIALTADAFSEDIKKCKAAGMTGHIAKPIDPDKMYATILAVVAK